MFRRAVLSFSLPAVICSLLFSASGRAQFPELPNRCTPTPDQTSPRADGNDAPHQKVIIERITFDVPVHLDNAAVAQVIARANQNEWTTDNPVWGAEFAEVGLRGAWQDQGYFRVNITAQPHSLGGNANEERFVVNAHVDEGLQYHLGDVQFSTTSNSVPPFSEGELRAAVPLGEGELFDVEKIRKAIGNLTRLYTTLGYIDFTVTPQVTADDKLQRISLTMLLDGQKQFRVRNVVILGLEPKLEARLTAIVTPGEIFNPQRVDDLLKTFIDENQAVLPPDVSHTNIQQVRRDTKAGIADVTFDFRSCPSNLQ